MASDRGDASEQGVPQDVSDLPEEEPESEQSAPVSQPSARTNPIIDSLAAGLASEDPEMAEKCGIGLCLVAQELPKKTSTVIGELVTQIVKTPESNPVLRTLGTLVQEHGREIRGALMTETSYKNARRIYGRVEHADGWDLSELDIEEFLEMEEPSIFSVVMRLVEIEGQGRDPLGSDAWTLFIEQFPGDEGESASEKEIKAAAARHDARPRTVRRKHEAIKRIANSRTFRMIEERSRFDELEVLSPIREQRFSHVIRTRGRIGVEEYAVALRLCNQMDDSEFRRRLTDRLREWARLEGDALVTVLDWGDTPRPWVATEFVDTRLAGHTQLSSIEALEHAQLLARALVDLHRHGLVHGGIDPHAVGYPPNTLDGVVEPILDHVGLLPMYRRYVDPTTYMDIRYGAPEWLDDSYGGIDHQTDIYQLGMVLYWALTGKPPFTGNIEDIHTKVCQKRPQPPSSHNPNLPPTLDEIIEKATAKQKLLRYETATTFYYEVRTLCDELL